MPRECWWAGSGENSSYLECSAIRCQRVVFYLLPYEMFLCVRRSMSSLEHMKWISRTLGLFNVQIWTFLFRTYYLYYWLFDAACAIYIHSWWQAATTASRKIQFSCNLWQDISKIVCSSIILVWWRAFLPPACAIVIANPGVEEFFSSFQLIA